MPTPVYKEKGTRKLVIGIIIGLLVGAVIGLGIGYTLLSSEVEELEKRCNILQDKLKMISSKYNALQNNYNSLQKKYTSLRENYTRLLNTFKQLQELSELFEKQTREVFYYKIFTIYNYKTDEYWYVWYKIKAEDYYHYRFDVKTHTPAQLNNRFTEELIVKTVTSWRDKESSVIREIASDLWDISEGDKELFVNLVIQFVHQICYNETTYTKYPVETLVEGSGDCDNVAVLAASILNAKGFDVIVMLVEADGVGHAMLGVNIRQPDDLYKYGRDVAWYYEYNNVKYWLIEATWGEPGGKDWIDPATPDAYMYLGAFVGDKPWKEIKVVNIVEIKG